MTVAVLGASGMLGAMTIGTLAASGRWRLRATVRTAAAAGALRAWWPDLDVRLFDAETGDAGALGAVLSGVEWVVNAIGVIKPHIRDDDAAAVERATRVNAVFPYVLGRAAASAGARVLQIATDCVYSGGRGGYREADEHDPRDVYGRTKSLGEARLPGVHHLRCSIVGPELSGHRSLHDWLVRQPPEASVGGFRNHRWNGVTTLHFARVAEAIIRDGPPLPHVQHLVPADAVTKAALLVHLARARGRDDVVVRETDADAVIDRTLATSDPALNRALWRAAGYADPPAVGAMVRELGEARVEWPWPVR